MLGNRIGEWLGRDRVVTPLELAVDEVPLPYPERVRRRAPAMQVPLESAGIRSIGTLGAAEGEWNTTAAAALTVTPPVPGEDSGVSAASLTVGASVTAPRLRSGAAMGVPDAVTLTISNPPPGEDALHVTTLTTDALDVSTRLDSNQVTVADPAAVEADALARSADVVLDLAAATIDAVTAGSVQARSTSVTSLEVTSTMRWLHALRSCRLRRRRRGVGLADMTLAMVVLVVVIDGAVRFGSDLVSRNAVALTAGQLSRLADDVEAWAAAEYTTLQLQVDTLVNDTEEQSWVCADRGGRCLSGQRARDSTSAGRSGVPPCSCRRQSLRGASDRQPWERCCAPCPPPGRRRTARRPGGRPCSQPNFGDGISPTISPTSSRKPVTIFRASSGRSGRYPTRSTFRLTCTGSPCPVGPSSIGLRCRST